MRDHRDISHEVSEIIFEHVQGDFDLFARLKGRHSIIGTCGAAKSIAHIALPTRGPPKVRDRGHPGAFTRVNLLLPPEIFLFLQHLLFL